MQAFTHLPGTIYSLPAAAASAFAPRRLLTAYVCVRASTGNCPHRRRDAAWPRSSTGELINSKSFLITRRAEHGQRLVSFAVGGSRNRFGYTRRAVFPDYTLLPFGMYTLLKTFEVKDSSFHPGTYTGTLNVALTFAQQKR